MTPSSVPPGLAGGHLRASRRRSPSSRGCTGECRRQVCCRGRPASGPPAAHEERATNDPPIARCRACASTTAHPPRCRSSPRNRWVCRAQRVRRLPRRDPEGLHYPSHRLLRRQPRPRDLPPGSRPSSASAPSPRRSRPARRPRGSSGGAGAGRSPPALHPRAPDSPEPPAVGHLTHHTFGPGDSIAPMSMAGNRSAEFCMNQEVVDAINRQREPDLAPGAAKWAAYRERVRCRILPRICRPASRDGSNPA